MYLLHVKCSFLSPSIPPSFLLPPLLSNLLLLPDQVPSQMTQSNYTCALFREAQAEKLEGGGTDIKIAQWGSCIYS